MAQQMTKQQLITRLQQQLDEMCGRYDRALRLFHYLDLDPAEVTVSGAPVEVFAQFKKDIENMREMVKKRTVTINEPTDVFTTNLKKKPSAEAYFSLNDIARFIREAGLSKSTENNGDYL